MGSFQHDDEAFVSTKVPRKRLQATLQAFRGSLVFLVQAAQAQFSPDLAKGVEMGAVQFRYIPHLAKPYVVARWLLPSGWALMVMRGSTCTTWVRVEPNKLQHLRKREGAIVGSCSDGKRCWDLKTLLRGDLTLGH